MLKAQKKISKKEIKEDKLVTSYFKAQSWFDQNKRLVSYLVSIPVIVLVAIFFWTMQRTKDNEAASTRLAKVFPYFDQGRFDLAINGVPQEGTHGLKAIVDEYGSTPVGELATFYLANAYFAQGNYAAAREAFDGVDVSDKMISAAALAGVGACDEVSGKFEEAAGYFEKAASVNMTPSQAPDNLQRAAVNYAAAGKKDKAVELLKTLKKEFSSSVAARDADRLIAEYSS
jgi:TolA-binding protein